MLNIKKQKSMSTRANVIFKEGRKKIYLYHHYDGYVVDGVGYYVKQGLELNPNTWWQYIDEIATRFVKKGVDIIQNDGSKYHTDEFEITTGLHGDVEYIYVVDFKKRTLKGYQRPGYEIPVTNDFEKTFKLVMDEKL